MRARDQCVVKSLQMRRFTKRGKEPSRGSAARSRHHARPERQKILLPEDFMLPRSCDTRFNYEAEMFHLRMRRWSVERGIPRALAVWLTFAPCSARVFSWLSFSSRSGVHCYEPLN